MTIVHDNLFLFSFSFFWEGGGGFTVFVVQLLAYWLSK